MGVYQYWCGCTSVQVWVCISKNVGVYQYRCGCISVQMWLLSVQMWVYISAGVGVYQYRRGYISVIDPWPLSEGLVTPPLGVEKLSPRLSFFDNVFLHNLT